MGRLFRYILSRNSSLRPETPATGFTLIEMLTVVVMIAILAAVAVPTYTRMVLSSKMTEATAFLGLMKAAEQRYFDLYSCYIESADPSALNGASGYNPHQATGTEENWNDISPWNISRLNINPGVRSTSFRYKIFASEAVPAAGNCGAAIPVNSLPDLGCVASASLQNNFFAGLAHWFVAVAKADLDKDGTDLMMVFPSNNAAPLVCDQSL